MDVFTEDELLAVYIFIKCSMDFQMALLYFGSRSNDVGDGSIMVQKTLDEYFANNNNMWPMLSLEFF